MKKAVLIGAGEAGRIVFSNQSEFGFQVVAWLDDDMEKHADMKRKVPTVGIIADLPKVVPIVDQIIVAIASADGKLLEKIRDMSGDRQLLVMPSVYQQLEKIFSFEPLRPVALEDMLSRPTRKINLERAKVYLRGGVVLIAGAGGSIGSELSNLVSTFGCKKLVLVDIDENGLEEVRVRLEGNVDCQIEAHLCDLKNGSHISKIFKCDPKIVFNCAAHKHVPAGQRDPSETVFNNLITTQNLLELCTRRKVEKFVHISTDKAIEPTSVMGASKALCESLIQSHKKSLPRKYILRFGNVLNSKGSVLRVWENQLKEGAALTITDPMMERFVMSISEACQLVLKSVEYDPGKYILDMGDRISVKALFEAFLRLNGLKQSEVRVKYGGMRAGEKFEEVLFWPQEKSKRINSEKIYRVERTPAFDHKRMIEVSSRYDDKATLRELAKMFSGLKK